MSNFIDLEHCKNSFEMMKIANERNMKEKFDLQAELDRTRRALDVAVEALKKYKGVAVWIDPNDTFVADEALAKISETK